VMRKMGVPECVAAELHTFDELIGSKHQIPDVAPADRSI